MTGSSAFRVAERRARDRGVHRFAGLALGLRLVALSVVAGSCLLQPALITSRPLLAAGVGAGALIAWLQDQVFKRWGSVAIAFIPGHVLVWTFLMVAGGVQSSPLFVGYVLELPLSGALFSRRGCILSALSGALAFLAAARLSAPAVEAQRVVIVLGFLAVSAALTWFLIEVFERQQREIERSRHTLLARANGLTEELRLLGDYLSGALFSLSAAGRVAGLNPAGAALLGTDRREALGRPWQEVLHLDARGVKALCAALAEGEPQRGVETTLEDGDGRRVAVQAEVWVTPSNEGRTTHVLLDPNAGRGLEDDPVRRLGEAAACVAHQVKNSIHGLQAFAERMEREGSPAGLAGVARYSSALHSLGELVEDVLGMAGAPGSAAQNVPLADALRSAMALGHWPGIEVRVRLAQAIEVRTSRPRLVHSLFNLIDNACRASRPSGCVEIRAEWCGSEVHIEIVDSGPGLSPKGAELGGAPRGDGSGYGLIAVRRFLEGCGGRLCFRPNPTGGTCCRVILPGAPEVAVAAHFGSEAHSGSEAP
ncbi:MAG TPA: ATP-binding protein [Candidatus Eisenbacteria bacterium]|jgi:PAS domain S-box-containing protein